MSIIIIVAGVNDDLDQDAAENLMVQLASKPLEDAGAIIHVAEVIGGDPGLAEHLMWTLDMRHPHRHTEDPDA